LKRSTLMGRDLAMLLQRFSPLPGGSFLNPLGWEKNGHVRLLRLRLYSPRGLCRQLEHGFLGSDLFVGRLLLHETPSAEADKREKRDCGHRGDHSHSCLIATRLHAFAGGRRYGRVEDVTPAAVPLQISIPSRVVSDGETRMPRGTEWLRGA